jgi:hypothetical protein
VNGQTNGYVISSIPRQAIDLVNDDVVNVLFVFQTIQQLLQSGTIG